MRVQCDRPPHPPARCREDLRFGFVSCRLGLRVDWRARPNPRACTASRCRGSAVALRERGFPGCRVQASCMVPPQALPPCIQSLGVWARAGGFRPRAPLPRPPPPYAVLVYVSVSPSHALFLSLYLSLSHAYTHTHALSRRHMRDQRRGSRGEDSGVRDQVLRLRA